MQRLMHRWLVLILVVAACDRPAPRTPEAGYRTFAEALRRGESKAAWACLSKPTQALMEAKAKELFEATRGLIRNEPALLLFQTGMRPGAVGEVSVVSTDGGTAVLQVAGSDSSSTQVTMQRDGDRWLVDLSDILQEKKAP
jgi:hypothetical protein